MQFILFVSFFVLVLDQCSKVLAVNFLDYGATTPVLENVFHLTLVYNRGVAFGLFNDNAYFAKGLVLFGTGIVIYMVFAMRSLSRLHRIAAGMMIGGAVGNIIDRIRVGAVIDYFDFMIWPVFNVADSFITFAAGLFVILIIKEGRSSGS